MSWDIKSPEIEEVDGAKIEAISKLPYPTTVKAIRSFLGHAGFYRRFIKAFFLIIKLLTYLTKGVKALDKKAY